MITFFIVYIVLLLLSSTCILGWYDITRGYYIIQPDNSRKFIGEIFGKWEIFFEEIKRYEKIYYRDDALKNKLKELDIIYPKFISKFWVNDFSFSAKEINDIENVLRCKVEISESDGMYFYIEEPIYRFHEWIRKPISACCVCMANPYGTLAYFVFGKLTNFGYFDVFAYKVAAIFVFWIVFIVILSKINSFLFTVFKKY